MHEKDLSAQSVTGSVILVSFIVGEILGQFHNVFSASAFITHAGQTQCELCHKEVSCKHSLVRHMRTHTGERPHPCDVCGKRFVTKDQMVIHHRIHTGEKPYKCPVCGRAFRARSDMNRHIATHQWSDMHWWAGPTWNKWLQCATLSSWRVGW